jgi:hypothetical protein
MSVPAGLACRGAASGTVFACSGLSRQVAPPGSETPPQKEATESGHREPRLARTPGLSCQNFLAEDRLAALRASHGGGNEGF